MCRAATALNSVEIADGRGVGRAGVGRRRRCRCRAPLPAVVSITEALPDARFPNFKGIMAAKKKPFETLTLADLGVEPEDHGGPRSIMIGCREKPPRAAGVKIVDEGDAGEQLAEFLIQNRLV